jgi:hypothetical protein
VRSADVASDAIVFSFCASAFMAMPASCSMPETTSSWRPLGARGGRRGRLVLVRRGAVEGLGADARDHLLGIEEAKT